MVLATNSPKLNKNIMEATIDKTGEMAIKLANTSMTKSPKRLEEDVP